MTLNLNCSSVAVNQTANAEISFSSVTSLASPESSKKPNVLLLESPNKLASWKVRVIEGRIVMSPPKQLCKKLFEEDIVGDLIYRAKDTKTGKRYFGSVKQTETNDIFRRFATYERRVNDEALKKTYFENFVHAHPRRVTIGIVEVREGIDETGLLQVEENWQDKFDTRNREHGFNIRRPTTEPKRTGPRKKMHVTMKKVQTLPLRPQSCRPAAIKAKSKLRASMKNEGLEL